MADVASVDTGWAGILIGTAAVITALGSLLRGRRRDTEPDPPEDRPTRTASGASTEELSRVAVDIDSDIAFKLGRVTAERDAACDRADHQDITIAELRAEVRMYRELMASSGLTIPARPPTGHRAPAEGG